jgi:putative transposase
MLKTFRYRLYPNQIQRARIRKTIDACRFVYNWALEITKTAHEKDNKPLTWYDLNNRLPELKHNHPFLKSAYSQSLQWAVKRVHLAFRRYINGLSQTKEPVGYPKFKRRKATRKSFEVPQFFQIDFTARRIWLPKIGAVKAVFHRLFSGIPKTCTVVMTITGKYFISIVVDDSKPPAPKQEVTAQRSVGLDVGLKTYVTVSTGEKVANPQHLQNSLQRLKCLHRRLSKKRRESRNREKARLRLARCYEKISNQRSDFQQKLSIRLIRENQAIMVESLNISGMLKNRRLAQAISDAAWSTFLMMIRYKAEWYGVTVVEVGRFEPTSKRCHNCGAINGNLTLSDRVWICPNCGRFLDRDVNAAKNIKMMGLMSLIPPREPRVEPVELSAIAEALKQETSSIKTE